MEIFENSYSLIVYSDPCVISHGHLCCLSERTVHYFGRKWLGKMKKIRVFRVTGLKI